MRTGENLSGSNRDKKILRQCLILHFNRTEQLSASVDFPMSLYWRDLARLHPQAKVVLTVRDPVRWSTSVRKTIREMTAFMGESWLGLPLRIVMRLTGKSTVAPVFTCWAPTYLGPKYPKGKRTIQKRSFGPYFFQDCLEPLMRAR